MKLNKTQVNALTKRIYDELYDNIKKHNDDLIKESVHTFLKTDTGKAVTKINTSFFNKTYITKTQIENMAIEYYGYTLNKYPSMMKIESDIILDSIASDDLNTLIETIKERWATSETN
jgi:hypothetical protein